jgi:antitoxin HigA-1
MTGDETIMPPLHPGEVLAEEFLQPLALSQYRLANDLKVPPRRINEIVHGKPPVARPGKHCAASG